MAIAAVAAGRSRKRRKKKDVIEYLAFLNKSTPLHCAAYSGDATRCRVLLEEGADPTLLNARRRDAAAVGKRAGFHTLNPVMFGSADVNDSPKLTSSVASPSRASMPTRGKGSRGSLSDISSKLVQLLMPEQGSGSSILDRITPGVFASNRASQAQYDAATPQAIPE